MKASHPKGNRTHRALQRLVATGLMFLGYWSIPTMAEDPFVPPKPEKTTDIKVPLRARILGLTGTVTVAFTVNATGHVRDVELAESSGQDVLDLSVLATIPDWRFFPAVRQGKPVSHRCRQKFHFPAPGPEESAQLLAQDAERESRRIRLSGSGTEQLASNDPKAGKGVVKIAFRIDSTGRAISFKILESSGRVLLDHATAVAFFEDFQFDPQSLRKRYGTKGKTVATSSEASETATYAITIHWI
ncbi:MAG: TonB family protein [Verrucomicrobiales bacterium]|nr:TonB family protein [Verrucomicrobiales bacterium]